MDDGSPDKPRKKRKRRRSLQISWKFPALVLAVVIVGYVVTQGDPTGLLNGIIPGIAPQQPAPPPQPVVNAGAPPVVAHAAPAAHVQAPTAAAPGLPATQSVQGTGTIEKGSLVSPGDPTAIVQFVQRPPEEFILSLKVRRLSGDNTFAIGVPFGDRQVLV